MTSYTGARFQPASNCSVNDMILVVRSNKNQVNFVVIIVGNYACILRIIWVKTDCQKRAWKAEEGGRRIRGRPKLRWKDCVKRDLERAGTNGQEWKTTAEDRGKWRTLTMKVEEAIK